MQNKETLIPNGEKANRVSVANSNFNQQLIKIKGILTSQIRRRDEETSFFTSSYYYAFVKLKGHGAGLPVIFRIKDEITWVWTINYCDKFLKREHKIRVCYYRGIYHYLCLFCNRARNWKVSMSNRRTIYFNIGLVLSILLGFLIFFFKDKFIEHFCLCWSCPFFFLVVLPLLKSWEEEEFKPFIKEQKN